MKNKLLLVVLAIMLSAGAFAQDLSFNKWTIEAGAGVVRPAGSFSAGFKPVDYVDFLNAEFGVRYMFNEFFGLKLSFDYDQYKEGDKSLPWETTFYGIGLEGVANLGRVFKFHDWTKTFNVLAHAGAGVGQFDFDRTNADDRIGYLMGGLTLQAKLSPRVALNLDGGARLNYKQDLNFDGVRANGGSKPFVYTTTLGLSVALGKHSSHADWYIRDEASLESVYSKINSLESDLRANSNRDGQLATRVDQLGSKVTDVERKLDAHVADRSIHGGGGGTVDAKAVIAKLINDGYVNIFFDYNGSRPNSASIASINALRTYLNENPGTSVVLKGYADERGNEAYNKTLSQRRADAVAKLLTDAGISSSRITARGEGEDISIKNTSPTAYQLARRVSFELR